jgi:hypothetical protein
MNNTYEKNQMICLLYRIFQAEEYRWYTNDGKFIIPTLQEIEDSINDLESSALECKGFSESGRIRVHYNKENDNFEYFLNLGGY